MLANEDSFTHSPFFEEQLTAFQVWLQLGSERRNPPEQLPIVLQVCTLTARTDELYTVDNMLQAALTLNVTSWHGATEETFNLGLRWCHLSSSPLTININQPNSHSRRQIYLEDSLKATPNLGQHQFYNLKVKSNLWDWYWKLKVRNLCNSLLSIFSGSQYHPSSLSHTQKHNFQPVLRQLFEVINKNQELSWFEFNILNITRSLRLSFTLLLKLFFNFARFVWFCKIGRHLIYDVLLLYRLNLFRSLLWANQNY